MRHKQGVGVGGGIFFSNGILIKNTNYNLHLIPSCWGKHDGRWKCFPSTWEYLAFLELWVCVWFCSWSSKQENMVMISPSNPLPISPQNGRSLFFFFKREGKRSTSVCVLVKTVSSTWSEKKKNWLREGEAGRTPAGLTDLDGTGLVFVFLLSKDSKQCRQGWAISLELAWAPAGIS